MLVKMKDGSVRNVQVSSESYALETINFPAPTAGVSTTRTKLPASGALRNIQLLLNGSVTMDASADGALVSEGIKALINEIRIVGQPKGSGKEVGILKKIDFAALYRFNHIMESIAGLELNPTPITKSAANSPFYVSANIDFRMPWSNNERRSLLLADQIQELYLEVDWLPLASAFTAGVPSVGSTPITLQGVVEYFTDAYSKNPQVPYDQFLQVYREKPVLASQSDFSFELNGKEKLRGIMIKTFTRSGVSTHTPVDSVINSITLMADNKPVKAFPSLNSLKAKNQRVYGVAMATGYSFLDFMSEKSFDTIFPLHLYNAVELRLDVTLVSNAVCRIYPCLLR